MSVWDFFIMIGIYKITSPTNKIYIGQSINIEKRFSDYKRLKNVIEQPKLYNSLKKHGVDRHKFEVVLECEVSELNDKERYYQELFNCIKSGLNCNFVKSNDRSGALSDDTKLKISISKTGQGKGIPKSEKLKKLVSENNKKRIWKQSSKDKLSEKMMGKMTGELNPFFGKTHSIESKLRISNSNIGRKSPMEGKSHSLKTRLKISLSNKGNVLEKNSNAKIVLDVQNGVYYDCVKELAILLNVCRISLARKIRGERKNNTNYIYV